MEWHGTRQMGWVVDTYVGVGVGEEQRVGKQREFVEWQVAHFQKKLQIKKKKQKEKEKRNEKNWKENSGKCT